MHGESDVYSVASDFCPRLAQIIYVAMHNRLAMLEPLIVPRRDQIGAAR